MKIIAFSGRKQSAKNLCATQLTEFINEFNKDIVVKHYSFADALKSICIDILGLEYNQCYGSDEDKNTPTDIVWNGNELTARQVMQIVGTDIFRSLKPNVWTEATIRKIQKDNPDIAIITDCRFPNEIDAVHDAKGIVIRLTRSIDASNHPSESALDKENYDWNNFDIILDNKELTKEAQFTLLMLKLMPIILKIDAENLSGRN